MLKLLRNPIALLLLTAAVPIWTLRVALLPHDPINTVLGHHWDDSPPIEFIDGEMHRPIYEFAQWCLGKSTYRAVEIGISLADITTIVRDANGLHVFDYSMREEGLTDFETLASIHGSRRVDEFGLLSGFAVRHRTRVQAYPYPPGSTSKLTRAELDEALNNSMNPDAPRVIGGVQTKWVFKPFAAINDFSYFVVLLAWIYAIFAVPRWAVWRRRNACPSCGYSLEGLASPVCPECGKALPLPRPAGEGAREAGG